MLLEPCTGWREILRAFIHKQFAFCCSSVDHSRHFRYTFATHRPQFCPGSRVGNAIVQTRDGSVCTDGSQKYPGALWTTPSTATQTMGGVCAAERLCAVQQRQTAVNNVGWAPGGVGYLSAFLCLSLQCLRRVHVSHCRLLSNHFSLPLCLFLSGSISLNRSSFPLSSSFCLGYSISVCLY